jgi:microcin C transport system permease protein
VGAYLLRRLILVVPTLFGIILINFAVVQFAPGGPVEQMLAELRGQGQTLGRITGEGGGEFRAPSDRFQREGGGDGGGGGPVGSYRGARGLDPAIVAEIERAFGFDKPAHVRFWEMLGGYLRFDFGRSLFRDRPVVDLIVEKMPVSISLGLWSTLIIYLVSIPLGIRKAVRDGSRFDVATSGVVLVGYAIPGFLFAILLVVLFAGGTFLQWFPLRGLTSPGSELWPFWQRALDYAWHMALPTLALVIGGFAGLTMLTKNAFLDEIGKQYVMTARAKGADERRTLYGHVFRNAMLLIIAGFPAAFIGILFTGALLIEIVFSLDGLGLLGFESAIRRDYPVMFGTLYIFTLLGLLMQIVGDFTYTLVDPRIDFEARR